MKRLILLLLAIVIVGVGIFYVMKPKAEILFFEKHQELAKLERKENTNFQQLIKDAKTENELYILIMEEGKEDFTVALPKIKEALTIVKKSKQLNEINDKSLKEAKELIKESTKLADKIDDKKARKYALNMNDLYKTRLKTFKELRLAYNKVLEQEQTLYGMLRDSSIALKEIGNTVQELSAKYEAISRLNEKFNKLTKEYNDNMEDFYHHITKK